MSRIFSLFLAMLMLFQATAFSQDFSQVSKELAATQKKYNELRDRQEELRSQGHNGVDRLKSIDGYSTTEPFKNLNSNKMGALYAGLKRFFCSGGQYFSDPQSNLTGRPVCNGQIIRCERPMDCPPFTSDPLVSQITKEMGLNLPITLVGKDEYEENRNKLKRLFYEAEKRMHSDRAGAEAEEVKKKLATLQGQKKQLDGQRSKLGDACNKFKTAVKGKIVLTSRVHGLNATMPTELTEDQAEVYIKALHKGMRHADALPPGEDRIEAYKNLRNVAEVLACEGKEPQTRRDIDKLENELMESYALSRNTNCATADQTDDLYNEHRKCVAGILDTMPTTLNELMTSGAKLRSEMLKQEPGNVLDVMGKEQIDGALDNLAQIHAIYDLDAPSSSSVCRGGGCGRFTSHIENTAHGLIHGPKKPNRKAIPNCGGAQMTQAQNRFKQKMQSLIQARQFSQVEGKRNEEFVRSTQNIIEEVGGEYPEIAPLMFSPAFINQADVDLDDMEMEFKPASCDAVKDGMRDALHENIRTIASPPSRDTSSESLARGSQKTKRFLSDIWNTYAVTNGMGALTVNGMPDYTEIDELYKDVPELRKYPKEQIHHLKSILKYRPELRDRYMKMFEGNAAMICALFKGIKKDSVRDRIVEKETKFIKGVAKAVGTVVAVASFFVNPAVGMMLTAAAFTTSATSNAGNISLLTNKMNDARNKQGQVMNDCVGNLARSPNMASASAASIRKHCQEAVSSMATAADLTEELDGAVKSAYFEAALYSAYMLKLAPQAFGGGGHHHVAHVAKAGEEVLHNAPTVAGKINVFSKINELAKVGWGKVAHGDNVYGALKTAKVSYYASKTPYIGYVFENPIKNGFFYATLEEEVYKTQKAKGGKNLSEAETAVISDKIKKRVAGMSESQITNELNDGSI